MDYMSTMKKVLLFVAAIALLVGALLLQRAVAPGTPDTSLKEELKTSGSMNITSIYNVKGVTNTSTVTKDGMRLISTKHTVQEQQTVLNSLKQSIKERDSN